jgi:hypothetical protein
MTEFNPEDLGEMTAFLTKVAKVSPRKKERKQRQKQALGAADRRSLRATGRDQQLNVKCSLRIKELLKQHVQGGGLSVWIEEAILAHLRAEGVQIDE